VRQRAVAHRLAQQRAQLLADHPLEATVGEGVVIGSNVVTGIVVSEVAVLRLASGLRWAGATRAALALRSTTLAGATEETFGVGASLEQYGVRSLKDKLVLTTGRAGIDGMGQGVANYYDSNEKGVDRFWDAAFSVNIIESGLAEANIRPVGLGVTSALLQYSQKGGFRTPFNNTVTWQAAGAQAGAAIGMGYLGLGAGNLLSKRLAYQLYQQAALRVGYQAAYPAWLGSAHLFRTVVPIGLGGLTSHGQNAASTAWPAPTPLPPLPPASQP